MSHFKQLLGLGTASEQHALAIPPRVARLYNARWMSLCFLGFALFVMVAEGIEAISLGNGVGEALWMLRPFLFQVLAYGCAFLLTLVLERWCKPIMALRLAALQGDPSLLAREQPHLQAPVLSLPVRCAMRLSRLLLLLPSSLVALLFLWLTSQGLRLLHAESDLTGGNAGLSAFVLGLLALVWGLLLLLFLALWSQRQWVQVSEDGIASWSKSLGISANRVGMIGWQEVRLFACYRQPGPLGNKDVMIYEVASANKCIQWVVLQRPVAAFTTLVPTLPFDAHRRQMQELCAVVRARTGLPLYDVSQRQDGEGEPVSRSNEARGKPMG